MGVHPKVFLDCMHTSVSNLVQHGKFHWEESAKKRNTGLLFSSFWSKAEEFPLEWLEVYIHLRTKRIFWRTTARPRVLIYLVQKFKKRIVCSYLAALAVSAPGYWGAASKLWRRSPYWLTSKHGSEQIQFDLLRLFGMNNIWLSKGPTKWKKVHSPIPRLSLNLHFPNNWSTNFQKVDLV